MKTKRLNLNFFPSYASKKMVYPLEEDRRHLGVEKFGTQQISSCNARQKPPMISKYPEDLLSAYMAEAVSARFSVRHVKTY